MQKQKKALGKGLNALIGEPKKLINNINNKFGAIEIDINKIEPNLHQPRKFFNEDSLIELAESIKNFGIIQPLIVQDKGDYYSIIAGERRWRAARIAKLEKIPVVVKNYSNLEIIQIALIENIQREDLNPIEEAYCYQKLSEEFFFSQEEIAEKIGKKRSIVSTYLSLLKLDEEVQQYLSQEEISVGHGKALLKIKDSEKQIEFCEKIIEENLNIKQINILVNKYNEILEKNSKQRIVKEELFTPNQKLEKLIIENAEKDLNYLLGTKVKVKNKGYKGKIEIEYYTHDDFDRLLTMFKKLD